MYDYIVIGGGPCGLTTALYLAKYNRKILLIEKEDSVGGCHRVRRVNGLFTEHGPRITINNYFLLMDILAHFNLKFDDVFVKYDFSVNVSTKKLLSLMNFNEMISFMYEFIKFMINENASKNITMKEFTLKYGFKSDTSEYIDTICRLTDGGTIDNYTLYEFLQIFNQNIFYNTYQPRLPNDIGLFKYWIDKLQETNNVNIMYNSEIISIVPNNNKINHLIVKDKSRTFSVNAKNYIFAIPPKPMLNIIGKSPNRNMFGDYNDLLKWEKDSRYLVYIPINFHWDKDIKLIKKQGVTDSDYGIVYFVMSDYMKFNDARSKVVLTCTVKITDRKSSFNNKTANECTDVELIKEVFRQLKLYQPHLPDPTYSILSPGIYKNNDLWDTVDTAYFYTKAGFRDNKSIYDNLFWIGTHNGNSEYSFTSMESAISNAITLLHEIEPQTKKDIKFHQIFTFKNFILIIIIVILILCITIKYKYKI
jgi:hypothetical protein